MIRIILFVIIELVVVVEVLAGGLRTSFLEVVVKNLEVGRKYCITKLNTTYPLVIENTFDKKIYLKMQPLKPDAPRGEYLPIPDVSWVEIEPDFFEVPAKGSAHADIYIHIPEEEEYLSKKYYFKVWSYTTQPPNIPGSSIGVGLISRVLFETSDKLPLPEFNISHQEIKIEKPLKLGVVHDINKLIKSPIKIINKSDKTLEFIVSPIQNDENISCYFLIPGKYRINLPPKQEIILPIYLAFPKEEIYKDKEFLMILNIKLLKFNKEDQIKFYITTR